MQIVAFLEHAEVDEQVQNPYKVFHSTCESLRKKLHVVLVRPENGGNVGSIVRALANMGINGTLRIVGAPTIVNSEARKMAKHAGDRLDAALFYPSLDAALRDGDAPLPLAIAATARVGSAHRPHPIWVRPAMTRAVEKMQSNEVSDLFLVFGPESDGLQNEEIALCDWVVTIPSGAQYRSLNLAQAVLVFSYEVNSNLMQGWGALRSKRPSQRGRLIQNFVSVAEEVGFILPGDPFKMKPRLEEILSTLPSHLEDVKTLHGLLDQMRRTVRKGRVDYKGRYRNHADPQADTKITGVE